MRLAVAAALGSLVLTVPALAATTDGATATFSGSTLSLKLHYLMTCGHPGPGPLSVTLPAGVVIGSLHATVNSKAAPVSHSGRTIQVTLAKPPGVTCMSIAVGTLRVSIEGLHADSGTYAVTAQVNHHSFRTSFRVG